MHSRRLGVSLGVNLMPNDRKVCSFDCLYCECGFGQKGDSATSLPEREYVARELEAKLRSMAAEGVLPDVITFAGNGEPTLHPQFAGVIDDTIALRNQLAPKAKVAVLSNASRLGNTQVAEALGKVDDNILKIDAGDEALAVALDRPRYKYSLADTVEQIAAFGSNLVVQTMFVSWEHQGVQFDNSTPDAVEAWLRCIERIRPPRLMIYTIARDTPLTTMYKVAAERLDAIADLARRIVPDVSVSY